MQQMLASLVPVGEGLRMLVWLLPPPSHGLRRLHPFVALNHTESLTGAVGKGERVCVESMPARRYMPISVYDGLRHLMEFFSCDYNTIQYGFRVLAS